MPDILLLPRARIERTPSTERANAVQAHHGWHGPSPGPTDAAGVARPFDALFSITSGSCAAPQRGGALSRRCTRSRKGAAPGVNKKRGGEIGESSVLHRVVDFSSVAKSHTSSFSPHPISAHAFLYSPRGCAHTSASPAGTHPLRPCPPRVEREGGWAVVQRRNRRKKRKKQPGGVLPLSPGFALRSGDLPLLRPPAPQHAHSTSQHKARAVPLRARKKEHRFAP